MKKSYHSIAVPMVPAIRIRRRLLAVCSAVASNFRMRSSCVSGGGESTGAPSRSTRLRVSRSCQGAVSTTTGFRPAASSAISPCTASGSKSSNCSPSSMA